MDRAKVKAFFDRLAPEWDGRSNLHDARIVSALLTMADLREGDRILDVGCGTGVLTSHLLSRHPSHVTGIDLSPGMIEQAQAKFTDTRLRFVAADAYAFTGSVPYDRIIVYSAFPHFDDPARIIEHLAGLLAEGGRLMICHSSSRWHINGHHEQEATEVSLGLPPAKEVAQLMQPHLDVDVQVDSPIMYAVSGVLR